MSGDVDDKTDQQKPAEEAAVEDERSTTRSGNIGAKRDNDTVIDVQLQGNEDSDNQDVSKNAKHSGASGDKDPKHPADHQQEEKDRDFKKTEKPEMPDTGSSTLPPSSIQCTSQNVQIEPVISLEYSSQGTTASTISVDFQAVESPQCFPASSAPVASTGSHRRNSQENRSCNKDEASLGSSGTVGSVKETRTEEAVKEENIDTPEPSEVQTAVEVECTQSAVKTERAKADEESGEKVEEPTTCNEADGGEGDSAPPDLPDSTAEVEQVQDSNVKAETESQDDDSFDDVSLFCDKFTRHCGSHSSCTVAGVEKWPEDQ